MNLDASTCEASWRVVRPALCSARDESCGCEEYATRLVPVSGSSGGTPFNDAFFCSAPGVSCPEGDEQTEAYLRGLALTNCEGLMQQDIEEETSNYVNVYVSNASAQLSTGGDDGGYDPRLRRFYSRCFFEYDYIGQVREPVLDDCIEFNVCDGRHDSCGTEETLHTADTPQLAIQQACGADNECSSAASAECLTGQHLPDAAERFEFLVREIKATPGAMSDLQASLETQLLRLYEYHGGDPAIDWFDREFARRLYRENDARASISSCGPALVTASCDDDLLWQFDYCSRMTGSHIDGRLLLGDATDQKPAIHNGSPIFFPATDRVSHTTAPGFCNDLVRRTVSELNFDSTCDTALLTTALDIQRRLLDRTGAAFAEEFDEERCAEDEASQIAALEPMFFALGQAQYALDDAQQYADGFAKPEIAEQVSPELLDDRLAVMLGDFWAHLDEALALTDTLESVLADASATMTTCDPYSGLDDVGGPAGLVAFLQETTDRAQQAQRSAMQAAGTSLDGKLLAAVVGHIMQGLLPRLDALSASHDLACRIDGDCRAPSATALARQTDLAYTYRLLSLLDRASPDDGSSVVPDLADALSEGHDVLWRDAVGGFASSGGQQALIEALLSEVQRLDPTVVDYRPELLKPYPLADFSGPFRDLIASLNAARVRTSSYQKSGIFHPDAGATLYSPVHDARRDEIVSVLSARTADLDAELASFEADIRTLLEDLIQGTSNEDDIQRLRLSADILREQLSRNLEQQNAHAIGAAAEPLSNQIMQAWIDLEGVLESGSVPVQYLQTAQYPSDGGLIPVSGADAPESGSMDIQSLAVSWNGSTATSVVQVDPGDILSVQVAPQEQWAPKCIVESLEVYSSTAGAPTQRLSAPLTGPSGYAVTTENDVTSAVSVASSSVESDTDGRQATVCGQASAGFELGPVRIGGGGSYCEDISGTLYTESSSETISETTQTRSSAAFQGGLHSEHTPFDAPVGSLVVVEMPRGETDLRRFRDVHVVTAPTTSIVVRRDATGLGSDFYLAVNDLTSFCSNRGVSPDTRPLNVQMVTLTDAHSHARETLDAMGSMIGFMREQQVLLVAQGDILPNQLNAIEDEARGLLPASVRSASTYPPPLGEAFDALVTAEKSRLEHAVKLSVLQDEQFRIAKELNIIGGQIAFAQEKGELLRALPRWSVANLGLDFLHEDAVAINRIMGEFVLPVMELWYPEVLDELRTARQTELQALQTQTTTESLYLTGKLTRDIASFVVDAIPTASLPLTIQQYQVALSIPRPETSICNPLLGCDATSAASFTPNPRTSPAQAAAVWSAIEAGEPATFAVQPQDLYQPGGQGVLVCGDLNPVIRNIGVAIIPSARNDALSPTPGYLGVRTKLFNGRGQDFTASGGVASYRLDNERDLSRTIPIVLGNREIGTNSYDAMVQAAWAQNPSTQLVGRSPFASFTFDLSDAVAASGPITPADIASASELVLYMDIEVMEGAPSETSYVATCLAEGASSATCSDTIDNDRDGLFDCQDPDCAAYSSCTP